MMMFFYSLLLGAGLAVSSPWWLYRMATTQRYREGLRERLGRVPARLRSAVRGRRVVWIHAVSVGEVNAVARLTEELEAALAARDGAGQWTIVLSTTTRAGQVLSRERFGVERTFWFPLDFRWSVRAWLRALQPEMVVLMESELWPRLLVECARLGVPVAVANARLSDRSFRRAENFRQLWGRVLRHVQLFLAQGEESAERLRALGVPPDAIQVTGNLKYDTEPRESRAAAAIRALLGRRSLVVAGSLLEGEEAALLAAWQQLRVQTPEAALLLAPRHPERFEEVARLVEENLPVHRVSRLAGQAPPEDGEGDRLAAAGEASAGPLVILLDTIGDLAAVYSLADVAFVGGSLVPRGGHNPLEPARFGVPVVIGPSFENFREIVAEMQAVGGIAIVTSAAGLAETLQRLLSDRVEADCLGQRGMAVFEGQSGATRRSVEALLDLLDRNTGTASGAHSTPTERQATRA